MKPPRALVVVMSLALATDAMAAGDTKHQEKGDLVWRQLQVLIDDHPGVYEQYTIGDPDDHSNHWVYEMEGPTERIRLFQQSDFETTFGTYYGAYTKRGLTLNRRHSLEVSVSTGKKSPTTGSGCSLSMRRRSLLLKA